MAGCKFSTEDPQILGSRMHDLVYRICAPLGISACKKKVMAIVTGVYVFNKDGGTEQVGVLVML